jgi:hypothetical protein
MAMNNKFDGLGGMEPERAAEIFGTVDKGNYLAHSIREIESAIYMTHGKFYKINAYIAQFATFGSILYCDRGCEIKLPSARHGKDLTDDQIRLILAHELGHLIQNIERLNNPEILKDVELTDDNELYAWRFARRLVMFKSEERREAAWPKKFIYSNAELESLFKSVISCLRDKRPQLYETLAGIV